jgi:hypothetical protein
MSVVDKIRSILRQSKKKLVFYFDADGTFKDELKEIANSGIRAVEYQSS